MKFLISMAILITAQVALAFDSTLTISLDELKQNGTIAMVSAGDNNQIPTTAARVLQLQLRAAGCSGRVMPSAMTAGTTNQFTFSSDNCSIKNKKTERCDSGFYARNLSANPNSPSDKVVGGDTYKVCVKGGQGSQTAPAPQTGQ